MAQATEDRSAHTTWNTWVVMVLAVIGSVGGALLGRVSDGNGDLQMALFALGLGVVALLGLAAWRHQDH